MTDTMRALVDEMRAALEPFAKFAELSIEGDGWNNMRFERDSVVAWFGPSEIISARSALARSEALLAGREGWKDISSAPKDRFIMLWCPEDQSIWLAKWQGGRWFGFDDCGLKRSGASAGDPKVVTGWFVEKWQPLPPPPTVTMKGEGE